MLQLMTIQANCDEATTQAAQLLSGAGLQVVRSFDLRSARMAHAECTCPHHGTAQCTCQFVVLLVYGWSGAPVTLVVHGHDGQTWLSLVDTPQQPADMKTGGENRAGAITGKFCSFKPRAIGCRRLMCRALL